VNTFDMLHDLVSGQRHGGDDVKFMLCELMCAIEAELILHPDNKSLIRLHDYATVMSGRYDAAQLGTLLP
jgi:hypothetical protein